MKIDARTIYESAPYWVQAMLFNAYAARIHLHRYGEPLRVATSELLGAERTRPERLREYQNERLRAVIRTAYRKTRYYREIMDERGLKPKDIRTVDDLQKLPILEKDTVRECGADLMTADAPRRGWLHGHTSGTTGSPLSLWYDRKTCVMTNAVDRRQKIWGGKAPDDWLGVFLGRMVVEPGRNRAPFWHVDRIHRNVWFSSFHLDADRLPAYVQEIRRRSLRFLEGYPSTLYILARFLLSRDERLPMKAVFTSSETLHPAQREAIESAFDCSIFDFYGLAERVIFAGECEEHDGKHLAERYGIAEILDGDGEPVEDGEFGYLVGTSLHNEAMPLIRYRTSDVSAFEASRCACGRASRRIEDITTKAEDLVVTPEGRMLSPSVLTHPFKPFDEIRKSQIVQERVDRVTVKLVAPPAFAAVKEGKLRDRLRERLGPSVRIDVEYHEDIPREESGKFRWVVSEVEHDGRLDWDEVDEEPERRPARVGKAP